MGRTNQLNIVAGLLVAIGCLAVFVPLAPNFPANNLDSGWGFALNAAVAKGLIFGRDIALTYGPYASVATAQYHPATDMRMIWSSCLLAMAFAGGLIILARDRHVLLALLLVPLLGLIQYYSIDPLFFCFPLVFILIACRIAMPATHSARIPVTASVRFGLALLVIALSLLPLIKGTSVITCVAMGALAWALLMVRGQKMLAMSGVLLFVAGISAFWVGAGQPLTELPTFFFSQGQFVSGYTDAMSFLGPGWEPIIYIVACCLLGLFYLGLLRSTGLSGIALAVGIALLLFMAFKSGFVRHDGHALIAAGFLGLVGWILMIGLPGGGRSWRSPSVS